MAGQPGIINRSRNPRRIHELRLFLLFDLRRMWPSSFRAVTVGCRKRFLAPKLYEYTASGQKTLKRAKINYNKSRNLRPKARAAALFFSLVCAECDSPAYFAGTVCHIFSAYSFIALSAANLPEQAVFIRDIEFQRFLSAQSSSILFCAWR